jgi:tRNA-splicing ligase RtcB
VGSGNHYVDVFADEAGGCGWACTSAAAASGHSVASAFLAMGQGLRWDQRAPEREVLLDLAQPLGHDYWHLMNLAGRYAYAGREWVARKVVALMGAREVELVHNHHNFAWRETHASPDGGAEELVVGAQGRDARRSPGRRGSSAARWATTR